jgi:hypothetical protein
MKKIFLFIALTACMAGCKKDAGTVAATPQTFTDFLKNSEWVGTLDGTGYQYAPPCDLKFNANADSVSCYALFSFIVNGAWKQVDSIKGKINSIENLPDGKMRINTTFPYLNDQSIYVTDRNKLIGISTDPSKPTTFQLNLYPLRENPFFNEWGGRAKTGPGTSYMYPDLSQIRVNNIDTTMIYWRNGSSVPYDQALTDPALFLRPDGILATRFIQHGARVYIAGYNEETRRFMTYFGVLLPSGIDMMVHSRDYYARLPNYILTYEPYGPNGVTPTIHKND